MSTEADTPGARCHGLSGSSFRFKKATTVWSEDLPFAAQEHSPPSANGADSCATVAPMPYSDTWTVPQVVSWAMAAAPRSVVDVGIGFGKFGLLLREALEVTGERYNRESWQVRIEGIEVFERYRTPLWNYVYDRVHIGSALNVLPSLGRYDLGICCDAIEHFDKDEGRRLLGALLNQCEVVIITTPFIFFSQGAAFDNPNERHLSYFSPLDFLGTHFRFTLAGPCFAIVASRSRLPRAVCETPLTNQGASLGFALRAARLHAQRLTKKLPKPARESLRRVADRLGIRP